MPHLRAGGRTTSPSGGTEKTYIPSGREDNGKTQSASGGRKKTTMPSSEMDKEDKLWLTSVVAAFKKIAGEDKLISFDEFKTALGVQEVKVITGAYPGGGVLPQIFSSWVQLDLRFCENEGRVKKI